MKIKNPLLVIFGKFLRERRKKLSMTSKQVSQLLSKGKNTSTFRMIESGNLSLNSNKVLDLIKIKPYTDLKFDKLSKFIVAAQFLETKLESINEYIEGVEELREVVPELKTLFPANAEMIENYRDNLDLFSETEIQKAIVNLEMILTYNAPFTHYSEVLLNKIEQIKNNTICILQPLLEEILKDAKKEVDRLDMNKTEERLKFLEQRINTLSSIELGFSTNSSVNWRRMIDYKKITGIFRRHENLSRKDIVEKHLDNFQDLWDEDFKGIDYMIITDNVLEVKRSVMNLKGIILELSNEERKINFDKGFSKINFICIDEKVCEDELRKIGLDKADSELWLYEDKKYKYGFLSTFNPEVLDKHYKNKILEYRLLRNREVREFSTICNHLYEVSYKNSIIV